MNLYNKKRWGGTNMEFIKINDQLFVKKVSDELYAVKEWNNEKQMFYLSTYTADEIEVFFDIKKGD